LIQNHGERKELHYDSQFTKIIGIKKMSHQRLFRSLEVQESRSLRNPLFVGR